MTEDEIELEQKRARVARRKLVYAFCAGLVLFLGAMTYEYSRDSPLPDDADMFTPAPVVPKEQNGLAQLRAWTYMPDFEKFAEGRGVDEETADKIRLGEVANDALVDEFLAQAQPAFAKLDGILAQPYFVFDEPVDIRVLAWNMGPSMNLADALALAARRNQNLGKYDEAAKDVARLCLLSRRLGERGCLVVELLTAQAIRGFAIVATARLLNDPALPPASRDALTTAHASPVLWTAEMQKSFRKEYQLLLSCVKSIQDASKSAEWTGGSRSTPTVDAFDRFWFASFRPNETLGVALRYYRAAILALQGAYSNSSRTAPEFDAYLAPPKPKWLDPVRPNYLGRKLLEIVVPTMSVETISFAGTAKDTLVRAALAARHYYDDHHALPAKLDDLVPEYLSTVPIDPFDGKPLRYDPKRGLIYSVGKSLKDNGGSFYLGKPKDMLDYEDPLSDSEQPTLEMTFQNPHAPTAR